MLDDLTREIERGVTRPLSAGPEAWLRDWVHVMFEAVRARRDLLRTLFDEVPYLDEIEEVRQFPARMFALATQSPREMTEIPYVNRASIFMLTTMVRSAVLESVIHPPPDVPAAAARGHARADPARPARARHERRYAAAAWMS